MQGPFNQQTDNSGFYTPLLGTAEAPQFATLIVRPHPGSERRTVSRPRSPRRSRSLIATCRFISAARAAHLHDEILGGNRLIANLFTIFGAVAVVLSAVGLYGVMSFSVSQRTQEIGIRMALGADARRILRMVMAQGAWQVVIGLVLGAGAAALLLGVIGAEALQNFLFGVNAHDPLIYSAVAALLAAVAAVACLVPALRATRVNPMVALRAQ